MARFRAPITLSGHVVIEASDMYEADEELRKLNRKAILSAFVLDDVDIDPTDNLPEEF